MSALIERVLQDPVPLGTWLSITTGIMLAVFGYIRTRLQDRKRYTLDVLMRYSHSVELLRSLHAINAHVAQRKSTDVDAPVDAGLETHLAVVLPYFQSIALAANSGLLDREIMLKARYGSMKSVWEGLLPYIARKRLELGRPFLYADLEQFLRDNADRYARYHRSLEQGR